MTQKQIVGVVVGVAVVVLLCAAVYRQFTGGAGEWASSETSTQMESPVQKKMPVSTVTPVPETVDDITDSIVSESSMDLSALDDEESSSLEDVDMDSESLNNLGTSYDENNL